MAEKRKTVRSPMEQDELETLRKTAKEQNFKIIQLEADINVLQREKQTITDHLNAAKSEVNGLARQLLDAAEEQLSMATKSPEEAQEELFELVWDMPPHLNLRMQPMFPGGKRAPMWKDEAGYYHIKVPQENAEKLVADPASRFKIVSGADEIEVSYTDGLYMSKRKVVRHSLFQGNSGKSTWIPVVIEESKQLVE